MSDNTNRTPKKTNRSNASGSTGSKRSTASSTVKKSTASSGTSGRKGTPRAKVPNARSNTPAKSAVSERKTRVSRNAPEVNGRVERKKDLNAAAKRDDIIIIVVTLICILMFLSYLGICGIVGTGINAFIFGLFGRLGYILPFIVWVLTVFFIANKDNGVSPLGTLYAVLLSSVLGALIQLAVGGYNDEIGLWDYFGNSSLNYEGEFPTYGGLLGGVFVKLLCPFVGKVAAVLILIALLLILFVLMTGKPFIMAVIRKIERRIDAYRRRRAIEKSEQDIYDDEAEGDEGESKPAGNVKRTKMKYGVRHLHGKRMGTVEVSFGKRVEENFADNARKDKKSGNNDDPAGIDNRYAAYNTAESAVNPQDSTHKKPKSIYIPGVGNVNLEKNAKPKVYEEEYTERDFEEMGIDSPETDDSGLKKETRRRDDLSDENTKVTSIGEKRLHSGSLGLNSRNRDNKITGIYNHIKDDEDTVKTVDIVKTEEKPVSGSSYEGKVIDLFMNEEDYEYPVEAENSDLGENIREYQDSIELSSDDPETDMPDTSAKEENTDSSVTAPEAGTEENKNAFRPVNPEDRGPRPVSYEEIKAADAKEAGEQYAKVTRIGSGAAVFTDTSNIAQMMEEQPSMQEYKFPPIDILKKGKAQLKDDGAKRLEMQNTIQKLQSTFESFGVGVKVTDASVGPTVTRYELLPDQGVKVKTITALSDDIKLALAAAEIRIEAPIPGKAAVGIEVPNKESAPVLFGDLIDSEEFRKSKTNLAFAVGKDISGKNIISDIGDMPHALIAGATGSGKSVCINALIMSILYKAKPSEVKMIMVDPKRVELVGYNGIPHLIVPVVTDVKKAAGALAWAVAEMDDRYKRFADAGVRDLKGFNKLMQENYEKEGNQGECPEKLPQIVIIVDELNDLMMTANSKEVEADISRLTQLARACGIHVILATQRPSVNVITGTIKANIPTRIAFAVSSIVDSRTILDQAGAEKLLGKGDMLFYPRGCNKPVRLQGVYVSDDEVNKAVEFIKEQYKEMKYNELVSSHIEANAAGNSNSKAENSQGGSDADANDALFVDCGRYIIEKQKSSVGALQRVFKIGFNRAARIMDQLCEAGVVGPEEGTKARTILMSKEEFEEYVNSNQKN